MLVREFLSANVKSGRKRLGLSQEKLAELVDLSTQTISDIEGCRTWVSDKTLSNLAKALEVDIFRLLTPPLAQKNDDKDPFMSERIDQLRQDMKNYIDRRLDQFLRAGCHSGD
jgi:transcriptional regulator with XRE-family HTH domain